MGCARYADWWEVLTEDGQLVYRRILAHSHTDEQPFARSGGPVAATRTQRLVVRAHMSVGGYGGQAFSGTVAQGLEASALAPTFAADVADAPPQPDGCAF